MKLKLDRKIFFEYLRLILLISLAAIYFMSYGRHWQEFFEHTLPLAKNNFLFVQPLATTGECDVSDFTTFYASGDLNRHRLFANTNIDIYDPLLVSQAVAKIVAPLRPGEVYNMQYTPLLFALFTPLAFFDIYTAWCIWSMLSAFSVVVGFLFLAHKLLKEKPQLLLGLLICFASTPVIENFSSGQTTGLEFAVIAISLRLLMKKNYFWSGLIAGLAFLKPQQAPIILIPGLCLGRKNFLQGLFAMIFFEAIACFFIVGPENMLNFITANYSSEITRTYVGLNETWAMNNFKAFLYSLPQGYSRANIVSLTAYLLCCLASIWLWLKVYPLLQKVSQQAFELIAAFTTILLVYFSLHGYLYDLLLLIIPGFWLYTWSIQNGSVSTIKESLFKLALSLFIFSIPFLFWTNNDLALVEDTYLFYQLRLFAGVCIFTAAAYAALNIEFKHPSKQISTG